MTLVGGNANKSAENTGMSGHLNLGEEIGLQASLQLGCGPLSQSLPTQLQP